MTITSNTYTERVLIVLNADGSLKGAHQNTLTVFSGSAIPDQQGDAVPLTAGELASVIPTQEALLAQVMALEASHAAALAAKDAEHTAAIAAKDSEHATAIAALTAERDAAISEKATAESALAPLQAERDALYAQLHPTDTTGFAVLSPVQIRLGLLAGGITSSQVRAIIAAIEDAQQREVAETYWDYATEYHRDHQLIGMFAGALGLSAEQVDAMWNAAANL